MHARRQPYRAALLMFFFFNDTATTEIYTLSLHDALPISSPAPGSSASPPRSATSRERRSGDRKSTRLNSSHRNISYAVFCLKKTHTYTHASRLGRAETGAHHCTCPLGSA